MKITLPSCFFGYLRSNLISVLQYFRINDPYRLISLLILMVFVSIPWLIDLPDTTLQELKGLVLGERIGNKIMYVEIVDRTPPLFAVMDGIMNFFFGRSILARHSLALLVLFFQAAFFSILLIQNKAYNESTYLPSLLFGFLCFFSFDLLALTPELIASTMLLFALNNIFKEIEFRVERDSIVLNLGVFLGLASLFVFSYTLFLFGAIFILIAFARATLRKILLLLFGYGLTHGIVFTIYYFLGQTSELWTHFYIANVTQSREMLVTVGALLILGGIPLVYFVISLFMLIRNARFTRYQSQLFQVLLLWLVIATIESLLTPKLSPHSFIIFIPPFAYSISHYLLLIRRRRMAEGMLWIFLVGLLTVSFMARHQQISRISYEKLFPTKSAYFDTVKDKRIMIIGEDLSLYQRNSLGGSFLDWELSRKYFEHPEYYRNLIKVYEAFREDSPDVIIDEKGLMKPFVDRIPELEKGYRKEGLIYWRR